MGVGNGQYFIVHCLFRESTQVFKIRSLSALTFMLGGVDID
jgi:hypothetical protein